MKTMNTKSMILTVIILTLSMQVTAANTMLPMNSTSAMQGTGSRFRSNVIEVEAPQVKYTYLQMYSTSIMMETGEIPTPFSDAEENGYQGPRRGFDHGAETGQSDEYPIGEPWILLLFAAAAAATVAVRQRRQRVRQIAGCNGLDRFTD